MKRKTEHKETVVEKMEREYPWLMWWERRKIAFSEFLARWFNIHLPW